MLIWIGLAIVGLLIVFFFRRGSGYGKVFDGAHLAEFAEKVRLAKAVAEHGSESEGAEDLAVDGRVFLSSAGISFVYTIMEIDDEFHHHFSISRPNEILPHAVGEPFTIFIARVIGVPLDRLTVEADPPRFFHGRFQLNRKEQAAFAGEGMQEKITPEQAQRLFAEGQAKRAEVFHRPTV